MMKNYILLLIIIIPFHCYSQQSKIDAADKKYNNYAYIDAIKTYEKIAQKGYKSEDMFKKLGNSYYFNSDFDGAVKWYSELYAMNANLEPEYYYRYAQCLKSIGQIDKANIILDQFNANNKNDNRGQLYKKDINYLDHIKANSGRYKIEDAGINTKYSDYGSFVHGNKIYFASARDTGNFSQRKHKWSESYFTNIYTSDIDPINKSGFKVNKLKAAINTRFHESSLVFTKNGKTVYFTRNNCTSSKKGKDKNKGNKVTLIKIYRATLENDKWTNITELPFTSDSYNTAHPALSSDEKTLYFASDMPGTFGQSDLYKVSINNIGGFGSPVNLGRSINTEGKETFPYITNENEIYFASDGHPGLGGLDVFTGKIVDNGVINEITNLGADINSPKDDFAYIIDPVSRKGYFSSNKDGGHGSDDIYKFLEVKTLKDKGIQELKGIITDTEINTPLPGIQLTLFDSQFNIIKNTISDEDGGYSFDINYGKQYYIRAKKEDYTTKEVSIIAGKLAEETNLSFALEKATCKVAIGDDLGKCFGIKMIYFKLDKFNITTEAALDLEKILDVLNSNPTMKLKISSHTDSRQTAKYNEVLSNKRVKSTIQWLVKKGISPKRLTGKGYGETQLVNGCFDGVKCTEEEHQVNRRSQFIIINL